jgi:hypothetical protein
VHKPLIRPQPIRGCFCCNAPASAAIPRRKFLAGVAAAGLTAAASGSLIQAARAASGRRLIDVHSHIVPPFYLAENRERIAGSRGGEISRAWLEWTPQQTLGAMNEHGVETAMLSLSTPGVWFGNAEEARATARRSTNMAPNSCAIIRAASARLPPFRCRIEKAACARSNTHLTCSRQTASACYEALTGLIPTSQILFGSDFPYRALGETADGMPQLGPSESDLTAIGRDNALALLPRLKAG